MTHRKTTRVRSFKRRKPGGFFKTVRVESHERRLPKKGRSKRKKKEQTSCSLTLLMMLGTVFAVYFVVAQTLLQNHNYK